MPWLYLLVLSIVILVVWWALSRSAATTEIPGPEHTSEPDEGQEGVRAGSETSGSSSDQEEEPEDPVQ